MKKYQLTEILTDILSSDENIQYLTWEDGV